MAKTKEFEEGFQAALIAAASLAAMFTVRTDASIHPDIPFNGMNESAKTAAHTTAQQIAMGIKELTSADRLVELSVSNDCLDQLVHFGFAHFPSAQELEVGQEVLLASHRPHVAQYTRVRITRVVDNSVGPSTAFRTYVFQEEE